MQENWADNIKNREWFRKIMYFFPVQLLLVHFKNNQLLIIIWAILIGFITESISQKYGIPYLYLTPEYMGEVSFLSYFIVGFSFGGFVMAFNISSYITNGHRFPFIATLSRPFLKYFLNNIPWVFILIFTYIYSAVRFLAADGVFAWNQIVFFMFAFLLGFALLTTIHFTYFINTNKDFIKLFGKKPDDYMKDKPVNGFLHKKVKFDKFFNPDREWNVETYLSAFNKIAIARNISHYDQGMLKKVFQQNHLNAALFEIAIFVTIIFLSFGSDIHIFMIPAGASINLMFTMFIMLASAIHSWFRGWTNIVILILFLSFNHLSQYDLFSPPNRAYGLNYEGDLAPYTLEELQHESNPINYRNDYLHTIQILNRWKAKNTNPNSTKKPKMVLITSTGGGMRSALWSFYSMQYLDSITNGQLLKHTQLITGSSGGLIGMAYLRELYLQKQEGNITDLYSKYYSNNMSKDVLNRLGFSWTVNDMIFKLRSFNDGKYTYKRDRGYAFEQQLNENTDHVLDKRLYEYYLPELESKIPMTIISPTILNDGRRLLISPQPISYLTYIEPQINVKNDYMYEAVEFKKLFKNQDATNLRFVSALRMSSTFPFVMPTVHLPSDPEIKVMDAGIRDNYGIQTTMKFLYNFRNWIEDNTSGVVIVQIRDVPKQNKPKDNGANTFLNSMSSPVSSIYKNLFIIQDYNHDQLIQYASEWFNGQLDVVDFILQHKEDRGLSLSWHLTETEKKQVFESINFPKNQANIEHVRRLIVE